MQTTADSSGHVSVGVRIGAILLAVILGLILGVTGVAIFAHHATRGEWDRLATRITGRELSVDLSQSTLVSRIRLLERLETVTYSMDRVVEGASSSSILPDFLVGDKLLLMVHGEAIAGVDLTQLKPSDVTVHGRTVIVHLPPAQLFITALDDSRTRVFSRSTGWFVRADPNLESEVRSEAEEDMQSAALNAGILYTAHNNAATTLTKFLLGLGFNRVHID